MPSFPEVVVLYMHFRVMDSSLLYAQFFCNRWLKLSKWQRVLLYRKEIILEKQNCNLFVVLFVEKNSITVVDDCRRVYIGVDILSVEIKRLICFGRLAFIQITAAWLLKDTVLHLKQEVVQYFVKYV